MKYQKINKTLQNQLRLAALMLRYRTIKPTASSRKYLSYRVISQTLNLTQHEVQHICRKSLKPKTILSPKKILYKLEQEHVDFLLNHRTLELWAGLTMKERALRFHRKFTDKRVSVTSLRRLYLKNGIKRKKVRQEKKLTESVK